MEIRRTVKYLGVLLDTKSTFAPYLRAASASAVSAAKVVGRLIPNMRGPSTAKRHLLSTVVSSKPLYATPEWAHQALTFGVNVTALTRAQKTVAIRVARCYRTVSATAALFLAEVPRHGRECHDGKGACGKKPTEGAAGSAVVEI